MIKLKALWNYLRSSLWFLPTLIVMFNALLAIALIELESIGGGDGFFTRIHLFGSGPQEARIMLSMIAGSMMTIVGITFSMTLMTLALASNQYTSRILRNFMRNRLTKSVIGFFVGIFVYCLIVLCTIRTSNEGEFVPNIAVFVGLLLALGGVSLLIFFIHLIASSIQASSILSSVAKETFCEIDRIYSKDEIVDNLAHVEIKSLEDKNWHPILSNENGYIQSIDIDKLLRIAKELKMIIRVEHQIGDFVVQHTPLVSIALDSSLDDETVEDINSAFLINGYRTMEEDISFGVRQLVDIALKALSPGVNDTTTAVMCLNYLTAIMVRLASTKFNYPYHFEGNKLRLITKELDFESVLNQSFNQIRENAKDNITIILMQLESLRIIATQTTTSEGLEAIEKQTREIIEIVENTVKTSQNREKINDKIKHLKSVLIDQFNLLSNIK